MAVTDAYITPDEYRRIVKKTDPGDDNEVAADITAVCDYLDAELWRYFTKDASATTRQYYAKRSRSGDGGTILVVEDIASTSGFEVRVDLDGDGVCSDEDALAATGIELLPLNADKGRNPRPWEEIRLTGRGIYSTWPLDTLIEVTAIHGWPTAVPEAIKRGVAALTGILRLESPRATRRVSELGEVIGMSRDAQLIVDNLTRHYGRRRF